MNRLAKFKQFHKKIFLEFADIDIDLFFTRVLDFAEENNGTIDGDMSLMFLAAWYVVVNEFEEALSILLKLEQSNDPLVKYGALYALHMYYTGHNNPAINLDTANEYREKMELIFAQINFHDDWERYFTETLRGGMKMLSEFRIGGNVETQLQLIDELRVIMSKLPEYGYLFKLYFEATIGLIFLPKGLFEEAKQSFERFIQLFQNSDIASVAYKRLAELSIIRSNLVEAEQFMKQGEKAVKRSKNAWILFEAYNMNAYINELKLNYQKAETLRLELIEILVAKKNLLLRFKTHYELVSFYMRMFHLSKDQSYLTKALKCKDTLMDFSRDYPDNITIVRLSKLGNALILKLGGIKDKAIAIDIFEELLIVYPSNMDIKMNLVGLYFEDLSTDLISNTKDRIEVLLEEVEKSPLMRNPTTITEFSKYQILVAKYSYYLNGDIQKALDILYELKAQAEKYSMKQVTEQIAREIQVLESEVNKWTNISLSTQERINQSNINSYVKDLINIAKRSM